MRDNHPYGPALDHEVCVNGATRFPAGHAQVKEAAVEHAPTREQHIAERPRLSLNRRPSDSLQPGGSRQVLHLAGFFPAFDIRSNLLKANELSVEAPEDTGNTFDVTAAIQADALVDVIGDRREHTA
jgi:hypothetical protein